MVTRLCNHLALRLGGLLPFIIAAAMKTPLMLFVIIIAYNNLFQHWKESEWLWGLD